MSSIKITQRKSLIGCPDKPQKRTMRALGFGKHGKINRCVTHKLTPPLQGMINKVHHLVTVEKL